MTNLYARAVFFVKDLERAREFYVERLGFSRDWGSTTDGSKVWVCQVSLFGFELILNEVWGPFEGREGHGRVYIGLENEQIPQVLDHIKKHDIETERVDWGQPTLVVRDLDGNEIYFWDWPQNRGGAEG